MKHELTSGPLRYAELQRIYMENHGQKQKYKVVHMLAPVIMCLSDNLAKLHASVTS